MVFILSRIEIIDEIAKETRRLFYKIYLNYNLLINYNYLMYILKNTLII